MTASNRSGSSSLRPGLLFIFLGVATGYLLPDWSAILGALLLATTFLFFHRGWGNSHPEAPPEREPDRSPPHGGELLHPNLLHTQRQATLGEVAGGVAHDFNNLLLAISGFGQIALQNAKEGRCDVHSLERLMDTTVRARDLVRQILIYSHSEAGNAHPVSLPNFLKDSVVLVRAAFPPTVSIEEVYPVSCPPILAQEGRLLQILLNLTSNSVHAMPDRCGRLRLEIEYYPAGHVIPGSPPVQLEACVCLRVTDNGGGMEEAVQQQIFKPFFTTKKPGEGTGLGLAVVHSIVQAYRGHIRVSSQVGRGTTFELFFPALEAVVDASAPTPEAVRGRSEKLLFVDDEEGVVDSQREVLTALGYSVDAFTSVSEALAAFMEAPQSYQLVITDQAMPEMTGMELAARLHELRPDLPIILTTGYVHTYGQEQLARAGIARCLSKPYFAVDLSREIATILRTK